MSGRDAEEAQKTADSGRGEGRAGHTQMSSRWMPESWFTLLPAGCSRGLKGENGTLDTHLNTPLSRERRKGDLWQRVGLSPGVNPEPAGSLTRGRRSQLRG